METKAHYVLIGAFTLLMIAVAFGLVLFFSGASNISARKTIEVVFNGSIAGLSRGSAVTFNGLRIGEVTSLGFVANDPSQVAASVQVDSRAPIKADAKARLESQGLTGSAVIALTGGSSDAPELIGKDGAPPVLTGEPSHFQDLVARIDVLSGKADSLIAKADKLLGENSAAITDTVQNVDAFSKALSSNADGLQGALAAIADLSRRAGPLADHLTKLTDDADQTLTALDPAKINAIVEDVGKFAKTLADSESSVKSVISDVSALAAKANQIVNENDASISDTIKNVNAFSKVLSDNGRHISDTLAALDDLSRRAGPLADRIGKLADDADQKIAAIDPAKIGAIVDDAQTFVKSLADSGAGIQGIVDGASDDLAKIGKLVDDNGKSLADTLGNVNNFSKMLSDNSDRVSDALATLDDLTHRAGPLADRVGKLADDADQKLAAIDPAKIGAIVDDVGQFAKTLADSDANIKGLITDAGGAFAKVGKLLDDNGKTIADTLGNVSAFSKMLSDNSHRVSDALATIDDVTHRAGPLADQLGKLASDADRAVSAVDPTKVGAILDNASKVSGALADSQGDLQSLLASAASAAKKIDEASGGLSGVFTHINDVVSSIDKQKVQAFIDGAGALGQTVSDNRGNIDRLIKNTSEISAKLDQTADKFDGVVDSAQKFLGTADAKGPLAQISEAARSVRQLADDTDVRIKEISVGLSRFSASGLREYEALAIEGRRTVNDLDRLLRSLESNPSQIIWGAKSDPNKH